MMGSISRLALISPTVTCTCKGSTNVIRWSVQRPVVTVFLLQILLLGAEVRLVHGQITGPFSVVYLETPPNVTSSTTAIFAFTVVDANGTNPCDSLHRRFCSFKCKLDETPGLHDCRGASFTNLQDGVHNFSAFVSTFDVDRTFTAMSEFRWRIDTAAPTTVVDGEQAFMNGQNVTVATNRASDLRVFHTPVSASSAEDLLRLLGASEGVLTPTYHESTGNRQFGLRLSNFTSAVSEVTVALAGNTVSNKYGTLVPGNRSTTFLYDAARPQAFLSTTSRAKTKETVVPFVVQFTESVFGFNSSGLAISGGALFSFKEIDKSTYRLEVKAMDDNLVIVSVLENQTTDVAGNYNLASSSIQVRHYETPWISVVLYSVITVGLLSIALVSGALCVSSSTLAAAGAVSGHREIGDSSRNLLGLACHLQVLAMSGWLSVSLPIGYREVTSGLGWLIPHVHTPWQDKCVIDSGTSNFTRVSTTLQKLTRDHRSLLEVDTLHRPALGLGDYKHYFLRRLFERDAVHTSLVNSSKVEGWEDFQENVFWIGVVGGGLILSHIILVTFLRWRTRAPIRGALIIPRFELYLLILSVPGLCQASAFLIRGRTHLGIVVGGLLLSVPGAFLVSVLYFLIYGIFLGSLVQFKEFRYEVLRHGYVRPQKPQGIVNLIAGTGYPAKWVRKSRLQPTFLPRYGVIFEDHKGPPTILVHKRVESLRHSFRQAGSTMDSDDDEPNDVVEVYGSHRILGAMRASYIVLDLSRRITLALVFGLYPESDHSWSQVGIVLGVSVVQFVYLLAAKPFRRRGVQVVETISLLSEVGIFAAAMALLVKPRSATDLNFRVEIFMLVILSISFAFQLVNEWYALLEQLVGLSTVPEPTLKDGLKKLAGGLILPFTPRRTWAKIIGPQAPPPPPAAASEAVSDSHPSLRRSSMETSLQVFPCRGDEPFALNLEPRLALPHPNTLAPQIRKLAAESVAQIRAIDVDSEPRKPTEEIRVEPLARFGRQLSNTDGGRRSRDSNSQELKLLRELARASFSRNRRDNEYDIEQRLGSPDVREAGSSLSLTSSPNMSPTEVDGTRYVRRRRQFFGMLHARFDAESISVEPTSDEDSIYLHDEILLSVPEIAHLVGPLMSATSNSASTSKGSGYVASHSMNSRDTSGSITPFEDREKKHRRPISNKR